MKVYRSLREFRKNSKEAFDLAQAEQEVVIYRGEVAFILKIPLNPALYKKSS